MVLSSVSAVAVACCHLLPLPFLYDSICCRCRYILVPAVPFPFQSVSVSLHLLLSSVHACSRLFTFGCIRIRIRTYSIISVSAVMLSGPGPVIRIWSLVSISGPCRILSCHLVLYPGTVVWVRYIWSGPVPVAVTKRLHLLLFPFSVFVPVTKRSCGPAIHISDIFIYKLNTMGIR